MLVRQRPGSAKGVVFMTLEDETGIANIVVWPKVMEQYRKEVMGARLILVEGYIQSSPEGVTHLVAQRMVDRSHDLIGLANDSLSRKHPVPSGAALIEPLNDDRREHPDNPGPENPSPAQRPHPAAVTGFPLRKAGPIRSLPPPQLTRLQRNPAVHILLAPAAGLTTNTCDRHNPLRGALFRKTVFWGKTNAHSNGLCGVQPLGLRL